MSKNSQSNNKSTAKQTVQNGKGSKLRPMSISQEEYAENFDNIFRKEKKE